MTGRKDTDVAGEKKGEVSNVCLSFLGYNVVTLLCIVRHQLSKGRGHGRTRTEQSLVFFLCCCGGCVSLMGAYMSSVPNWVSAYNS